MRREIIQCFREEVLPRLDSMSNFNNLLILGGSVNDPELATQSTPYWFGVYNKGPRIGRGGMADGWHSYGDGNLLKVTGTGLASNSHCAIYMPKDLNMLDMVALGLS